MAHNLNAVVKVLEQQARDHAAQTSLLSKRIEKYGMRLNGVL